MELRRNSRGHRIVTMSERQHILDEIGTGISLAEAARKYELAIWTIRRWQRMESGELPKPVTSTQGSSQEATVPLSEYKKLEDELKSTRKSLAKMTVDRDILKDAVEITRKKKWM